MVRRDYARGISLCDAGVLKAGVNKGRRQPFLSLGIYKSRSVHLSKIARKILAVVTSSEALYVWTGAAWLQTSWRRTGQIGRSSDHSIDSIDSIGMRLATRPCWLASSVASGRFSRLATAR